MSSSFQQSKGNPMVNLPVTFMSLSNPLPLTAINIHCDTALELYQKPTGSSRKGGKHGFHCAFFFFE